MSVRKDIIIFSSIRWDQPRIGSTIAMVKELSKTHRVFFIDRPFTFKDLFKNHEDFSLRKRLSAILFRTNPFMEVQTGYSNFVVATPGITLPINFIPPGIVFSFFNAINNYIVKLCIKRMVKKYKIKEFIYLNYFNPTTLPVLKLYNAKNLINIYYVIHDIRFSKYMSGHGKTAELNAIAKADLVLVSSRQPFIKLFSQSKNIHYFPNAVDFDFFNQQREASIQRPFDLVNIGDTKVIMFCGYLSAIRIDYKLLRLVCDTYPHCLVVLIGTYEEKDLIKYKLDEYPNLIILGNRRFESMPAYMKCAHVTIIPYLCNELNLSVYPLKLNEYLAMGKPVVSTHFSPDLDSFAEVIYISPNYETFLTNIDLAMKEDNDNRIFNRIKTSQLNNWTIRVGHLNSLIDQYIHSPK